jgi:putative acetyltransferase
MVVKPGYEEVQLSASNNLIRNETPDDYAVISDVTAQSFRPLGFDTLNEPYVIEALRAAGAITISLVAEIDDEVIGHIAFSPVTISDGTPDWYALGPVSVLPQYQRMGFGRALIQAGLERLKAIGARGCCLVGHPEYYGKVGFIHPTGFSYEGVPEEIFYAIAFDGQYPQGTVTFHEGFKAQVSPEI